MTTPLLDSEDTRLKWQSEDDRNSQLFQKQQSQDKIVPDAASLSEQPFYSRINTIRQDSASATAGAIAGEQTKQQYEAAIQAKRLAEAQAAAQGAAYDGMMGIAGGAGFGAIGSSSADWGGGGDQGIANVLRAAGFPENMIPTFMGIAMAESSGNPNATHSNSNGTIDQGLFQINSVHQGNPWYPSNPFDPLQSAKAALAIYQSQGLGAWTVYNTGAYKKFLPATVPPYVANTSQGLRAAQTGTAQSFTGVPTTTARAQALQLSRQVLNIPYVWGGDSLKTGVDCSGLVQQVYSQFGISMPRQARAQATTGVRVSSWQQLQPGDLVAFKWAGGYAGPNVVSHIAIYAGNGQIIEAAGGSHGDIRSLGNSAQDQGAIYIHTRFPGE